MAAIPHAENQVSRLLFAANLSFLFPEIQDFTQRYIAAEEAGFTGVECGAEVYNLPIENLSAAKKNSKLSQVLLNAFAGDGHGFTAIPSKVEEFKQCLELSIQYCKTLKCKRLHILAGQYPEGLQITNDVYKSFKETYINNLKYASQRLDSEGIILLIEPISTIPNYFLVKTDQAIEIIKELKCENVFLQLDLYHHQRTHGNITDTITKNFDYIGHIQISQVPGRHEPDQNGEINFNFVFNHLIKLGYKGWIGCEYVPSGPKTDCSWLQRYRYHAI